MDEFLTTVHTMLGVTPARWQSLARGVPTAVFDREPAPGEWSAFRCMRHVIVYEMHVLPVRVQAILDGRDFTHSNHDQDVDPGVGQSPAELADFFASLREKSLALVARLTPADLERGARHAEFGPVKMVELLNAWVTHDLNHLVQAERAMMQPFLQASGPWQTFFTDHVVRAKVE